MIKKIKVENFKAVGNAEFNLSKFNIFVGGNNSGKSSVLQAIQFAVGAAQTGKRYARTLIGPTINYSVNTSSFVYLPIRDVEALIHNRELTQTKGGTIFFSDGENETTIELKRGKNRNMTVSMVNSPLLVQMMSQQPYCVFTPGVSGISVREEFKTKASVIKSATRGDSNFFLRNILLLLKQDDSSWDSFNEKFHIFFPDYSLDVRFDADINEYIDVVATSAFGVELPIDALGTSALQILQILSYIYCFDPQLILLDEPDTHLHPNNQRKLICTLNQICDEKGLQIILSTHSRHMIDEANGIASFFWMQHGQLYKEINGSDSTDFVQIMLDLGALDKSDFLTNTNTKWVICTEDAKVDKETMLKSILKASGFQLEECVILPYKGCSKIETVVLLSSFIHAFLPDAKIIVHRDRDYLTDEEVQNIKNKMEHNRIKFWVTPGTDVESIFINENHIHTVYPELNSEWISTAIAESIEEVKENSLERFVNHVSTICKDPYPDYRKINLLCEQDYTSNINRYFYGKKTLGILKSKIQSKLHHNINLFVETEYIKQEEFEALRR